MIWAILAALGVPLWLCAAGIFMLLFNNRKRRKRYGDIPVRVRRPGNKRWTRGHAIWVSDVFAWRGSPAAWEEELLEVSGATLRTAGPNEGKRLHRLGDDPTIVTLTVADGEPVEVAAGHERDSALLGPFVRAIETGAHRDLVQGSIGSMSQAPPIQAPVLAEATGPDHRGRTASPPGDEA